MSTAISYQPCILIQGHSSSSPSAGVSFVVTLQSAGGSGSSQQAAQYPTKLGGFSYNPAESIPYTLNSDGALSTPNGVYSVLPGTSSEPFVPGTPAPGAITGTWSVSPDGTLSWVHPAFNAPGNAAAFYEDPSGSTTSGIIAVFDGSVPPAPYVPVELRTNPGKSRHPQMVSITNRYQHPATAPSAPSTLELDGRTLQSHLPAFRLLLQLQPQLGV